MFQLQNTCRTKYMQCNINAFQARCPANMQHCSATTQWAPKKTNSTDNFFSLSSPGKVIHCGGGFSHDIWLLDALLLFFYWLALWIFSTKSLLVSGHPFMSCPVLSQINQVEQKKEKPLVSSPHPQSPQQRKDGSLGAQVRIQQRLQLLEVMQYHYHLPP